MKQIALCDDQPQALVDLGRLITEYAHANHAALGITAFTSAEQLLRSDLGFDLIILDIQMQGMNGMDAARRLRERGLSCPILFLTAFKDYVFDAFDVDAAHYLLKPVDPGKLFSVIGKALREDRRELLVKQGYNYRRIRLADILYLEAMGRKVSVHLVRETLDYYQKFHDLPALLGDGFAGTHRSFIVNLDHVRSIDGPDVILDNSEKVPIAKGKKEEFSQRMLRHFRKDAP